MATYTQLQQGSRGSAVSDLQKLLNQKGYSLDVDGIFGAKTQAAVKDYQAKNNLTVDGIANINTWNSLYGVTSQVNKKLTAMEDKLAPKVNTSTTSTKSPTTPTTTTSTTNKTTSSTKNSSSQSSYNSMTNWLASYNSSRPTYQQSQAVKNAANQLAKAEAASPGSYKQSQAVINAANQLAQIEANRPGEYQKSQAVIDAANLLAQIEASRPGDYQQSQAVIDAANALAQHEANRPGEYVSNYADQIQSILDQIMNREEFSYDFSSDPMYQMYADRYQQQGQMAMMDAMGQAAALSGGYGNTYAQSVGQQTYQNYLLGLNDIIPELRNQAYQMYQDEGADMYNQIGLLQGLDESDYARYRDAFNDYINDRSYLYGKYFDTSNMDYSQYRDAMSDYFNDRSYYYGKYFDTSSQDYSQYRDMVADYFTDRSYYYGKYFDTSDRDYSQYRDAMNDYYTNRDYYYNKYSDTSSTDYNRFLNDVAAWENDRNFSYQVSQDALAQSNYEREIAYQQMQDELAQQAAADEQAYQRYLDELAQYNKDREHNRNLANDAQAQANWEIEQLFKQMQFDHGVEQDALDRAWNLYQDSWSQYNDRIDNLLAIAKAEEDGVDVSGINRLPLETVNEAELAGMANDLFRSSLSSMGSTNSSTVSSAPTVPNTSSAPTTTNPVKVDDNGSITSVYVKGLGYISAEEFKEGRRNGTIDEIENADGSLTYVLVGA